MPVVSFDQAGSPSLLKPIQAFRWFIDYGGRHGSLWENRVTRVMPPTPVPFSAYLAAPYIQVPTFMMVGRNDEMVHCNPDVTRATYDLMRCQNSGSTSTGGTSDYSIIRVGFSSRPVRSNASSWSARYAARGYAQSSVSDKSAEFRFTLNSRHSLRQSEGPLWVHKRT
jgi:hypothetical protein